MTCDVATSFAFQKVDISASHCDEDDRLSVRTRKAVHKPDEDMHLRVTALVASVLASLVVSMVSHVNGSFRFTHGKSEIWPYSMLP